jgi:hypothetical protein
MDRNEAKKISNLMRSALSEAMKKAGYDVAIEGGVFSSTDFKPKVTVTKAGTDLDKANFEKYARLFNVKPTDYQREVTISETKFKIVGFAPKSSRFPVLAERVSDGRKMKLQESVLAQLK